jgi:2,4-dienoyl-CoA reductase-like NADH-dependent reductase (Old Yellow Enzyme family)
MLFSPLTIRNVTLKNRIVVSPMCQYSSMDGFANDWHLVHLGSRAVGGAALVFTEATAVSPEGRISPEDLGLWKDDHVEFLKRVVGFIEAQGSVAGIQLAHAGRKASHESPWNGNTAISGERGWTTMSPSAIPYKENEPVPAELNKEGINKIIEDFRKATERALGAGFKVIEIHAAHGYLLHEFLSPLSNKRTDEYGGSFENRCRLLYETVEAVRKEWPLSLPLFVRISATDWMAGGWTPEDSVRLAASLKEKEVDLIDCSSGGNSPGAHIPVAPLYQLPFAETIKKETGILTGAVGLITTSAQAEEIISRGQADLVFLARQFLRDPYFPLHAAKEQGTNLVWPVQYERGK